MQINEDIRDREVRVVTDGGEQLGIMSAKEALKKAEERNLDLVKISPVLSSQSAKRKTEKTSALLKSRRFVFRSTLILTTLRRRSITLTNS